MTAIKQTVTIQPGGRVEVISDELPEGRQAEVIILVNQFRPALRSTDPVRGGQGPPRTSRPPTNRSIRGATRRTPTPRNKPRSIRQPTSSSQRNTTGIWTFFAASKP